MDSRGISSFKPEDVDGIVKNATRMPLLCVVTAVAVGISFTAAYPIALAVLAMVLGFIALPSVTGTAKWLGFWMPRYFCMASGFVAVFGHYQSQPALVLIGTTAYFASEAAGELIRRAYGFGKAKLPLVAVLFSAIALLSLMVSPQAATITGSTAFTLLLAAAAISLRRAVFARGQGN